MRDLAVLREVERLPRRHFVDPRHADLLARDLPIPIAGGQTSSPAWLVARMIEALATASGHRTLQVGAGSGYATAILLRLGVRLTACERVRGLAVSAERCCAALGIEPAAVSWADGLAAATGPFDRILVHACCEDRPTALLERLAPGGVLVCARPNGKEQVVARIAAASEEPKGWCDTAICPCRLLAPRSGLIDLD